MSTRFQAPTRVPGEVCPRSRDRRDPRDAGHVETRGAPVRRLGRPLDPAEEVALVAHAARRRLLSVHRAWLRWEDLEDCYSQATVELVALACRGELRCASTASLRGMLELRFVSRVRDRRRALSGRSPAQAMLDGALSLGGAGHREVEIADPRADVERRTMLRADLRSLERAARALSSDQRLVLACQVGLQMSAGEFCRTFGWSTEKHRKVAQRARARLRRLLADPTDTAVVGGEPSDAAPMVARDSIAAETAEAVAGAHENFFEDGCPALREASVKRAGTHL